MKKRTLSVILAAATIIGTMSAGTAAVYADDAKDDYTVGMTLNLGNLTWAELAESAKAHGKEIPIWY